MRPKQKYIVIKLILTKKMKPNLILSLHNVVTIKISTKILYLFMDIIFIITYAYFFCVFLSVYCNIMFVTIKKRKR